MNASRGLNAPARPPHSFLEFQALPRLVPHARAHTRLVLERWGMAELADIAELLVSELVTNAIRASTIAAEPVVRLLLTVDYDGLRISVWDGAPGRPRRSEQSDDAVGGRGLMLVEALSSDYGTYLSAGRGKVVWCVLSHKATGG
jgi:anti-sigma regulatory factor (Ser/Thr protein kinase)